MKVVLAGGAGALGRRIAADLSTRGDEVVVLTRSPGPDGIARQVAWDGVTVGSWASELEGAAVVNLAGELVDRRPTPANVALLTRSRVEPTRALIKAAASVREQPSVWVQMSTLAIYGDAGEQQVAEDHEPADEPPQMAGVARAWEAAAAGAPAGRQVILRTGVVFDRNTPALNRLTGLVRWGLGGRVGSGRQWVSWLHVTDLLAIIRRCLDDPSMAGVVHATSPNPIRNRDLMAALRGAVGRPPAPPTPSIAVRLGSIFLRTDPALALLGRRCVPARLVREGFTFAFPEAREALDDLIRTGQENPS